MKFSWLFSLKAAALLHDPPHKAWIIAGQMRGRHEEEAHKLADIIFGRTILRNALNRLKDSRVESADHLASGIDRWLLGILIGKDSGKLPCKIVKLKNIFDPKVETPPIQPPSPRSIKEFAEELTSILSEIEDERLAWHILYACYEALWIEKGLPPSPADTRTPTHTIFDHSYATSAMLNWFLIEGLKEPKGILLMIDLARIHEFVSSSRKLRDLWVSSYLVSAIAWRLAWIFIEKLGPDVLLIPTCRHNPFYYHSLLYLLKSRGISDKLIKKIQKLSSIVSGYNPDEDVYPRFAIIPGTLTLLLPHYGLLRNMISEKIKDEQTLKEFLSQEYQKIWSKICEICSERKSGDKCFNELLKELRGRLKEYGKYGFKDTPPLPLRVIIVDMKEVARKAEKAMPEVEGCKLPYRSYILYDLAMEYLRLKAGLEKVFKHNPIEKLKLTELTEGSYISKNIGWPLSSKRGFDYCTSCGKLPAIIIVPQENREEYKKFFLEECSTLVEIYFSQGERLCPYCLLKRLLSVKSILEPVLEMLLGKKTSSNEFHVFFPSTSDIASVEFKEKLVDEVEILKEQIREITYKEMDKIIKRDPYVLTRKPVWKYQNNLLYEIEKLKIDENLKYKLKAFIMTLPESLYFGDREKRMRWRGYIAKINRKLEREDGKKPLRYPRTHYSLIVADGDSMGYFLQGRISEATNISLEEYLINLFEGQAKEIMLAIVKKNGDAAKKLMKKYGISDYDIKISELSKLLLYLTKRKKILTSVAFHVSFSRALMRAAVRDSRIIECKKGIVVYTGGDDLMALAPVSQGLAIIYETRNSFSLGYGENLGFEDINGYLIPSLLPIGRSYCIYEAHYMQPMYAVISRAQDLLDKQAKEAVWKICDDIQVRKDSLVIAYSPRGGESTALILLKTGTVKELALSVSEVNDLLKDIDNGIFSTSLVYDLFDITEFILKSAELRMSDLASNMFNKVFLNNVPRIIGVQPEIKLKVLKYVNELMRFSKWTAIKPMKLNLTIQAIKSLKLVRSGLRGVPP